MPEWISALIGVSLVVGGIFGWYAIVTRPLHPKLEAQVIGLLKGDPGGWTMAGYHDISYHDLIALDWDSDSYRVKLVYRQQPTDPVQNIIIRGRVKAAADKWVRLKVAQVEAGRVEKVEQFITTLPQTAAKQDVIKAGL